MSKLFTRYSDHARCCKSWNQSRQWARTAFTAAAGTVGGKEEEAQAAVLRRCAVASSLEYGRAVHASLVKAGALSSSIFLSNHLLNMYCKCGEFGDAMQLFDEMPHRNVVTWSSLIAGLVQRGRSAEAMAVFAAMWRDGGDVRPNEFTLVSVLNACSLSEDCGGAYKMIVLVVKLGFERNVFLMNAFLTALIRHGEIEDAEVFFWSCPVRDTVSWNAVIAGYLQFCYSRIWSFWCRMVCEGVKPDHFTFATVLTGLATSSNLTNGRQVHAQLVKYGHSDDICVGNSLVDLYLKGQCLVDGFKAFEEMPQKDVVSWTEMSSGFLHLGQPARALELVGEMRKMGVKPNKFTLATCVNACAGLASIEEGMKSHGLRIKLGKDADTCVDNALIDMYSKCGCMEDARRIFRRMGDRSVISWTTLIMGYAQNGLAREALEVFEEMKMEDVKPNHITLVCVLYACSVGGLVDFGWKCFSSMYEGYGVSPGEDHYICMVDLLGKVGRIGEAEALIRSMPFRPGPLVWQTLIGCCRIHGNLETGRRAAEMAIALDKEGPSPYVLLSNMYADSSRWDSVGVLRLLMDNRNILKRPGCSWIETSSVAGA